MDEELQCGEVCGNRTGASSSCSNSSMGPDTEDGSEAEGISRTESVTGINVAPCDVQHESGETVHSTATSSASLRTVSALDDDKFCCVCGDRALGYNFDAITCESCKAFFRRNAAKQDTMKCMFSGDCSITINTRRFCSACRLRKCFLVGMKKDMILGEQEKKYRKEKVLLNKEKRLRKQQQLQHDILQQQQQQQQQQQKQVHSLGSGVALATAAGVPVVGSTLPVLTSPPTNLAAFCTSITERVTPLLSSTGQGSCRGHNAAPGRSNSSLLYGKDANLWPPSFMRNDKRSFGMDNCCPSGHCGGRKDPAAGVGCGLSNCCRDGPAWSPAVTCCSQIGVVKPMLPMEMSVDDQPAASRVHRELSDDESALLVSLEHAYDATIGIGCGEDDRSVNWNKCNSLELFLNHTGSFVRQFVAFSKRLHEFSSLPQSAQMTLLKSSVLGSMILRSAHVYDLDSDCWVNSRGERTSLDVLSAAFADVEPGLRDMHSNLVRSIKQLVLSRTAGNGSVRQASSSSADTASGTLIFALLHCIALLSPESIRPLDENSNDSDRRAVAAVVATVSDAQLRYIALLRRHLEAAVSYAGASELLPNFLQCLTMCKYYARQHGKAIMSCDASRVEPLLREVFNL